MRNLVPFEHLMRGNNSIITFLMEVVICESEAMDHMITKTSTRSSDPFKHMVHYTKRKRVTTFGDSYAVTCTLDEQLIISVGPAPIQGLRPHFCARYHSYSQNFDEGNNHRECNDPDGVRCSQVVGPSGGVDGVPSVRPRFDGPRYEKGGIVTIVEGEAHGGLGLRGGLLGVQTQSYIDRIIISKLTYKLGGLLLLSPIGFRMELRLGLYAILGEMLGPGSPTHTIMYTQVTKLDISFKSFMKFQQTLT
ncbi:hypothetical protein Tco_0868031 [Tanacetum coccineum]